MRICVIHGSARNGNTEKSIEIIKSQLDEIASVSYSDIYLPKDLPVFCIGCTACLTTGEYAGQNCPHKQYTHPVLEKLMQCDGFILTSPCYALAETAQVKSLLDHLACIYISHRPNAAMFQKIAFIVSTTGYAGADKVIETLKRNVLFWGVKRIITCKITMGATQWDYMPKKRKIELDLKKKTMQFNNLVKNRNNISDSISSALLKYVIKTTMKNREDTNPDKIYWKIQGWI
jgi:multimeric flavodoxin WrbA